MPSHIHYELLLQLLERQTSFAVNSKPELRSQVQQLIVTLRKAVSQQKRIESTCDRLQQPFEHRWSLNSVAIASPDISVAPSQQQRNI